MPRQTSIRLFRAALAAASFALVAACGGGGGGSPAPAPATQPTATAASAISRVIVAGDSLADAGTFGFRATVQGAAHPAAGYPVYAELVARSLGIGGQCSYFSSTDEGRNYTTRPGCTNFAVGSAAIVNPVTRGDDDVPFSLKYQLEQAVRANGGAWAAGDLVLVDAGGNDAAGLADAYRGARFGNAADQAVFLAFLGQQLSGSEIQQSLARANGGSAAATLYMQQLAQTIWTTVKANTLDRGATRVALVNIPDITLTPRYRRIAADIATQQGAAASSEFQAAVRSWIAAFNGELARLAAGDPRVVVVGYFDDFTAHNTTPAAFGLTNATQAACPDALDIRQCTDAALDAAPPAAGLGAGWWKTWLYADRFHPSPRGHELLAASVLAALQRAGWR
jgi:phospholipase/lecithinase/hemolysin